MKTLNIQNLKNELAEKSELNVFFVKAAVILQTALDINFDDKKELSDWVNAELDSDDFEVDQDSFIDTVNDIIDAVAEFYNLD